MANKTKQAHKHIAEGAKTEQQAEPCPVKPALSKPTKKRILGNRAPGRDKQVNPSDVVQLVGAPVGVKALQEASTSVSIPVFGIGGITPGKVQEVSAAGAWGVAVIRGVWAASDISHAVRAYLN